MFMKHDETKRYQADLDLFGEVSEWFGDKEEWGVIHASLELLQGKIAWYMWSKVKYPFETQNWSQINILQPKHYLPSQLT